MRRCGERRHLGAQLGRAPFGRIELRVLLRGVLLRPHQTSQIRNHTRHDHIYTHTAVLQRRVRVLLLTAEVSRRGQPLRLYYAATGARRRRVQYQ